MTVLVLRALGLGDLLTAFPALRGIRRAFPNDRVVLAAPAPLTSLARLSGAVDEVLDAPPLSPLAWRGAPPDVAVNLHGRGPESHRVLLQLRPSRLLAFAHAAVPESRRGPVWRADEHEVSRWCRLLREEGIAADPSELDLVVPPAPVPAEAAGATMIHPGAGHPARRWPAHRWIAVASAERQRGRPVIVTGGDGERDLARAIAEAVGLSPRAVFAGRTDVLGLARLVKAAARVVCGDTGVAHLATALRTPSVVLFGPTAPERWGPPAGRPWHRVLWAGTTGPPNGTQVDPGLLRIRPEQVTAALEELPALGAAA
jgi:ADP-heptose:LPS heptosyltransferase